MLACLADARGALVTRELLLERFWPDVIVADLGMDVEVGSGVVACQRSFLGREASTRPPVKEAVGV